MTKKDYIYKNDCILDKILNYWCLIRYARLSNKTKKITQWKHELLETIISFSKIEIEKYNTIVNRKHILKRMSNLFDLKTRKTIDIINCVMFWEEEVDIDTDPIYKQTVNEYIKELKRINSLIAKQNESKINEYVEKL